MFSSTKILIFIFLEIFFASLPRPGPAAFHIRTQGRFVPDPPVPDLSKSGRDRPIAGIKANAAAKAARRGDADTSMSLQAHVVDLREFLS